MERQEHYHFTGHHVECEPHTSPASWAALWDTEDMIITQLDSQDCDCVKLCFVLFVLIDWLKLARVSIQSLAGGFFVTV